MELTIEPEASPQPDKTSPKPEAIIKEEAVEAMREPDGKDGPGASEFQRAHTEVVEILCECYNKAF